MNDLEKRKTPNDKLTIKIKTGKYMLSPKSFNYIMLKTKKGEGSIKMPQLTTRQDALVDFIFSRLNEKVERVGDKEIMTHKEFSIVLSNLDTLPVDFIPIVFETTEVRKELCNKRYTDKQIISDLEILRREPIKASAVKVWAEEDGKYEEKINWIGSICSDIIDKETTKIGDKTVHKLCVFIGLITGLIWRNDILRKRYCLFPKDKKSLKSCYYRLPKPAQKIFRYISLWKSTNLRLWQFCDILNWSQIENPSVYKGRIENCLNVLEEARFIKGWARMEDTKSLNTRWKIWGIKTPERI